MHPADALIVFAMCIGLLLIAPFLYMMVFIVLAPAAVMFRYVQELWSVWKPFNRQFDSRRPFP